MPPRSSCRARTVLLSAAVASPLAWSQGVPAGPAAHLPEIAVRGPRDAGIGTADSASEGAAERASFQSRPKLRPGDIVEAVPGVVATQHSGDGKANQYFLRGFNLDHGTDFAVTVDGMPVNMPTHGHGQGYADLNFLIPELVSGVRYRKGPYFADDGDFSLAGSASMDYVGMLDAPFAELGLGAHGYRRLLAGGSRTVEDRTWLGAVELHAADGPWQVPERLRKANAVLRHSQGSPARGLQLTAMAYQARWISTDQVPERLIDGGGLPRFGSLNPTDGGRTRRLSLSGSWFDEGPDGKTRLSAYAIDYRFDLFSDFTYFLADPVQGDQFEQVDRRRVFGVQAAHSRPLRIGGREGVLSVGAQWRGDRIGEVGLYPTAGRARIGTVRSDRVSLDLLSAHAQQMLQFSDRLRGYAGLRADWLRYHVRGRDEAYGPVNGGRGDDFLLSPKAGLAWTVAPAHELYLNAGTGFHSNDVRGATITADPQTGDPAERVPALVRGRGAELGWRFQPSDGVAFTAALWQLLLDSELVYVGDAGTTEAGRASRRRGVEATLRYPLGAHWRMELDAAWSRARFRGDAPPGEGRYVDNAAGRVVAAGIVWQRGPWTATARLRHMGSRALDTTNTVRARPVTLLNVGARYAASRHLTLGLEVFNLADRRGNDIEYFYASCTAGEVAAGVCGGGIDGRHVHPMEPRSVRLGARWSF
ncbi:TonB-dependent receptor [Pseudorhodoferax sp.]|uniref:TonB-dependent receptor n=1 Tax=Pseudorhodoferax sp. TaxID=1993553 RepID=UPI0039E4116B